ncbi:MAG: 2-amino-4-hydroxy-6-hydroxymethyldihydropteridine diphosphokinase [Bacteroidales bacterium]|nr:2-amino-4-hydroxy-6-hydroxymethyldihydropteridine diphosphokinase [Bacteroidales bacterium]
MNSVYILLGGNVGNKRKNLAIAHRMIREKACFIKRLSNIYETEAWGFEDSGTFLNQAAEMETSLKPLEVLEKVRSIEADFGRRRDQRIRYQPRRMDIDILFYNSDVINLPGLIIPHPLLHLRNFVLVPLCELAADFVHPVFNKTILQLKNECKDEKWTRLAAD